MEIIQIPIKRVETLVENVVLSPDVILAMYYGPEIHRKWYHAPMRFVSLRYQNDSSRGHPTFFPNGCSFLGTSGRHTLADTLTTSPKKIFENLGFYTFAKIEEIATGNLFKSERLMLLREIQGIPPKHIRDLTIVVNDISTKIEFKKEKQWYNERHSRFLKLHEELEESHLPLEVERDKTMDLLTNFEIETCDLYARISRIPYEKPVDGKDEQDYNLLVASRKVPQDRLISVQNSFLRILQQ